MWISNWKNYLLAGLGACLLLTFGLLHLANSRLAEKTAEIESMKREAQQYDERSQQTAKETSDALTLLVEQIKTKNVALENARKRFGSCPLGNGLRLPTGNGQADSAPSTDATGSELVVTREFIDACAVDAGMLGLWQDWARKNELPVK